MGSENAVTIVSVFFFFDSICRWRGRWWRGASSCTAWCLKEDHNHCATMLEGTSHNRESPRSDIRMHNASAFIALSHQTNCYIELESRAESIPWICINSSCNLTSHWSLSFSFITCNAKASLSSSCSLLLLDRHDGRSPSRSLWHTEESCCACRGCVSHLERCFMSGRIESLSRPSKAAARPPRFASSSSTAATTCVKKTQYGRSEQCTIY